jgi:hypothetical protein
MDVKKEKVALVDEKGRDERKSCELLANIPTC